MAKTDVAPEKKEVKFIQMRVGDMGDTYATMQTVLEGYLNDGWTIQYSKCDNNLEKPRWVHMLLRG